MADDALSVSKLNVGPGGKKPHMHSTIIPQNNPFGRGGQEQFLSYSDALPEGHSFKKSEGQPKGMCVIAEEQGYMNDFWGKHLIGDCIQCKAQRSHKININQADHADKEKTDSKESESEVEDNRPDNCCLWQLLSMQDDFCSEKCLIQLVRSIQPLDLSSILTTT